MEILGYKIGISDEDKKIVSGYLKPYVKGYIKGKAKELPKKLAPKAGLKAVKIVSEKLEPTDYKKTKFVVNKAKDIMEKPYVKKQKAKQEKKDAKVRRKPKRIDKKYGIGPVGITLNVKNPENKKNIRHAKKLKKLREKGKLTLKAKAVSGAILIAHSALTTPRIVNKH